jgi:predicted XRE-type DNA-binding protein
MRNVCSTLFSEDVRENKQTGHRHRITAFQRTTEGITAVSTQLFTNVWNAIEDSPESADEMTQRSDLLIMLKAYIQRNELNKSQAAALFNVTEQRVADLLHDEIDSFDLDALIAMAAAAKLPIKTTAK